MQDQPVVVVMDGWCLREKRCFSNSFLVIQCGMKNFFSCFLDLCKIQEINELQRNNCISNK